MATDISRRNALSVHVPPSRAQVIAVLAGSGAIGFFLGLLWRPSWPDALEPAQVLAGLVTYPADNPVYLYSIRTWTVLHQVLAVPLSWGFSERALALMVSGVMGMVSCQALAVVILALSRDVTLAILSPSFIVLTNTTSSGVTYPVALMGVMFTYGVIGLSYLLLTIALIGAGQRRWGALLLGFGPAVHPTIGVLGIAVVALATGFGPRGARQSVRSTWPYFLAGGAAAALCAMLHLVRIDLAPSIPYLPAWGQHWDWHRQPFPLFDGSALLAYFSAGVPALWLWRFPKEVPEHARVLLRILIVAAVLGLTLSASYWIVPSTEPNVIPALMPSRLLNLNTVSCMALLIGLSALYRSSLIVQSSLAVLVLVILAITAWVDPPDAVRLRWGGMAACGVALAIAAERRRRGAGTDLASASQLTWLRRATTGMLTGALLAIIAVALWGFNGRVRQEFVDRTNDSLFATVAGRPGLLLTASNLHLIQLRTRRPVLLDGDALDGLTYVPGAVPVTERILQRVYGTDLRVIEQSHEGGLDPDAGKALWQTRTVAEWQDIAREFGITDVLTYAGWRLRLPEVASNTDLVLYAIPRVPE